MCSYSLGNPTNAALQPRISLLSDDGNADSEDTGVKLQKNSEGDKYVDLGKKKRVTVRSFKGKTSLSCTRRVHCLHGKKERL